MAGSVITTPISAKPWNPTSSACFRPDPVPLFRRRNIAVSNSSSSSTTAFFPLKHSAAPLTSNNLSRWPPRYLIASSSSSSSASSVGIPEYWEDPATNVKFPWSVPGCSSRSLSLLGTGYRAKIFAIIEVKVYAAGLYVDQSIFAALAAWKDRSPAEIEADSSLFSSIFHAPSEKALRIVLVRDVDGKTFWEALDEAISPRIKAPTEADQPALAKFRAIFENRPLNKGTALFLRWLDPSIMHVCVDGIGETGATIESTNVTAALFDVFFGDSPVSPSLKSSVATWLAAGLK